MYRDVSNTYPILSLAQLHAHGSERDLESELSGILG